MSTVESSEQAAYPFLEFTQPAFIPMADFWSDTLLRLLLSFVPMADLMHRNEVSPSRIGSFGSGSCSHEIFLSHIFPEAVIDCFDRSERYIPAYTRERIDALDQVSFTEVMVEDLDWSQHAKAFDFVFSIQTLEHIEDPDTALANLASTVSDGGWLYVDVPFYSERDELQTEEYMVAERARQFELHEHFHLGFSRTGMSARIEQLGFEIIDSGFSAWNKFDSAFLHLLRGSEALKKVKADPVIIAGMIRFMHALLAQAESANADSSDEIEAMEHKKRPAGAIRVLARRT